MLWKYLRPRAARGSSTATTQVSVSVRDGPAKALPQFDLHFRDNDGAQELPQVRVVLPLFFFYSVRVGEGQAWDDEHGHAVASEVQPLPRRAGGQQDTAGSGAKCRQGEGRAFAHRKYREGQRRGLQPFLDRRHGEVGSEQHQGVAVGCRRQLPDLCGQPVVVVRRVQRDRVRGKIEEAVVLIVKGVTDTQFPSRAVPLSGRRRCGTG